MEKVELGRMGEELAVNFLIKKGFRILGRNYRCPLGELDIIAEDSSTLVFAEVRTKSSLKFGRPVESLTRPKIDRIMRVAQYYIVKHNQLAGRKLRIDFIGVMLEKDKPLQIKHLEGIY